MAGRSRSDQFHALRSREDMTDQDLATAQTWHSPTTILVVGMHRSGTSLLAHIVNLMGAFVGTSAELVPAHPSINPTGFWERVDVVGEHDHFLQQNGFGWATVANFDVDRIAEERKRELVSSLHDIVAGMAHGTMPLVIKDPRLCLFLPVWQGLVAAPVHVFVVRDPRKVAASLMASYPDSFTTDFLVALWQKYVQAALAALHGQRVLFVAYTNLLDDAPAQQQRLQHGLQELGASGLSCLSAERLRVEVNARLDRSEPSPHAHLSAEQQRLFDWLALQCEAEGPVEVADVPAIPSPDAVLVELEKVRRACMRSGWKMAVEDARSRPRSALEARAG
jgi:hypothetical protein